MQLGCLFKFAGGITENKIITVWFYSNTNGFITRIEKKLFRKDT